MKSPKCPLPKIKQTESDIQQYGGLGFPAASESQAQYVNI
jgi:hypothetical protein